MRPRARPRPRGFSFVEAVIGAAIVSTMLAATSAVVVVMTRTIDRPSELEVTRRGRATLDSIADELGSAMAISVLGSAQITVTIPDRTGDAVADTVAYRWDGLANGTLYRQWNGGSEVAILTGVDRFDLAAASRSRDFLPTLQQEPTILALAASSRGTTADTSITLLSGAAESMTLTLPTATSSVQVTGIRLRGRRGVASSSTMTVALRSSVGLLPLSTVLSSTTIRGSDFASSTDWLAVDLPDVTLPAGTTEIAVTVTTTSALAPAILERSLSSLDTPWDSIYTGTLGAWLTISKADLSYELLGRVTVPKSTLGEGAASLRLRCALRGASESELTAVVPLPNAPTLP